MKGQKKPDLYVIVGPNGSGKSTIIENSGIADRCPIIINPDNFVKKFPDIEDLEQRYIAAMEYCREQREILLEQRVTFGFETVGTHEEKLEFIRRAKRNGYTIHVVFVDSGSAEKSIERVKQRVARGGHDVPADKIRKRYSRIIELLPTYFEIADEALYIVTWTDVPTILANKYEDRIEIEQDERFVPESLLDWYDKHRQSHQ